MWADAIDTPVVKNTCEGEKTSASSRHSAGDIMKTVIGVVVTCPHCHTKHVETLKYAKLESVNVQGEGGLEMAVVGDEPPEIWFGKK